MLNMDMTQLNTTLILLVGALGLNLVTGYTGMISIGNAGFFALGAMVASATGIKCWQLPFPVSCSSRASRARSSARSSACRRCGSGASTSCSRRSASTT